MNKVFIFTLGAAAGSLLTWKLLEKKYKRIADEEIASVKEVFSKRHTEEKNEFLELVEESKNEDKDDYAKQVSGLGYIKDEAIIEIEPGVERIEPYVITPEEYGEKEGFERRSLTCYADMVLADENEMIIDDPESVIGDALDHFGEYADFAVYVRDENNECDYEILKHDETYSEVNGVNM